MLLPQLLRHIELVENNGIEYLVGLQHYEYCSQYCEGNSNDSRFLTASLYNAFVLGSEVMAILGGLDCGVSSLNQDGLEVLS